MKRFVTTLILLVLGIALGTFGMYRATRYALCCQPNAVYIRHDGPPGPHHFPSVYYVDRFEPTTNGFSLLIHQPPGILDGMERMIMSVDTQKYVGTLLVSARDFQEGGIRTNSHDLAVLIASVESNKAVYVCEYSWVDGNGFTNNDDIYGLITLPQRSIPMWKRSMHQIVRLLYER